MQMQPVLSGPRSPTKHNAQYKVHTELYRILLILQSCCCTMPHRHLKCIQACSIVLQYCKALSLVCKQSHGAHLYCISSSNSSLSSTQSSPVFLLVYKRMLVKDNRVVHNASALLLLQLHACAIDGTSTSTANFTTVARKSANLRAVTSRSTAAV
jgi:hypothetical protein